MKWNNQRTWHLKDHVIAWGPHVFPLDPPACVCVKVVHPQNALGYTKITQGQVPRKFDLHTVQKVGVWTESTTSFCFFSLDCPNMGTPQISKITTFTWGMMIFCTGLWGSLVVQKDAESHVYREFSVSWRVSSCSLSCAARPLEIDLHWQVQSVVATCCHPHQRKRAWFHPFVGNLGGYRSRFLSLRSEDVWITA